MYNIILATHKTVGSPRFLVQCALPCIAAGVSPVKEKRIKKTCLIYVIVIFEKNIFHFQ